MLDPMKESAGRLLRRWCLMTVTWWKRLSVLQSAPLPVARLLGSQRRTEGELGAERSNRCLRGTRQRYTLRQHRRHQYTLPNWPGERFDMSLASTYHNRFRTLERSHLYTSLGCSLGTARALAMLRCLTKPSLRRLYSRKSLRAS